MNPESAFIAVSFEEREQLRTVIDTICAVLINYNIEPVVYVDKQIQGTALDIMEGALEALAKSSFLIAETSFKRIGVGVEVGFAAALQKPVIVVRQQEAAKSTTVDGVAHSLIEYSDENDLEKQLTDVLSVLFQ